jgi:hypothetical protein
VAVKILPPSSGDDPAFAERFTREAQALARLNHPNIVQVHDFGRTEDHFYFIMEYVDGVNLRALIRDGQLKPEEALKIVPQICEALQFAHDEGIVHRDIKPENILIDKKGRVKIADFGLAKLLGHAADDLSLTGTGQLMGTLGYMAPEQLQQAHSVDHRADIYSLGVVFYEMLTGQLPIGRFQPPSKRVQVDVRLDEIVLRSLESEPDRRYQHASDVKTDLDSMNSSATQPRRFGSDDKSLKLPRRELRASLVEHPVQWSVAVLASLPLILALVPVIRRIEKQDFNSLAAVDKLFYPVMMFGPIAFLGWAYLWRVSRPVADERRERPERGVGNSIAEHPIWWTVAIFSSLPAILMSVVVIRFQVFDSVGVNHLPIIILIICWPPALVSWAYLWRASHPACEKRREPLGHGLGARIAEHPVLWAVAILASLPPIIIAIPLLAWALSLSADMDLIGAVAGLIKVVMVWGPFTFLAWAYVWRVSNLDRQKSVEQPGLGPARSIAEHPVWWTLAVFSSLPQFLVAVLIILTWVLPPMQGATLFGRLSNAGISGDGSLITAILCLPLALVAWAYLWRAARPPREKDSERREPLRRRLAQSIAEHPILWTVAIFSSLATMLLLVLFIHLQVLKVASPGTPTSLRFEPIITLIICGPLAVGSWAYLWRASHAAREKDRERREPLRRRLSKRIAEHPILWTLTIIANVPAILASLVLIESQIEGPSPRDVGPAASVAALILFVPFALVAWACLWWTTHFLVKKHQGERVLAVKSVPQEARIPRSAIEQATLHETSVRPADQPGGANLGQFGLPARYWCVAWAAFLPGWVFTGVLWNYGARGVLVGAAVMALTAYALWSWASVLRLEATHEPAKPGAPPLRSVEPPQPLRRPRNALVLVPILLAFIPGHFYLVAAHYHALDWWTDRSSRTSEEQFDASYRGAEHRLLRRLAAFRDDVPHVEMVHEDDWWVGGVELFPFTNRDGPSSYWFYQTSTYLFVFMGLSLLLIASLCGFSLASRAHAQRWTQGSCLGASALLTFSMLFALLSADALSFFLPLLVQKPTFWPAPQREFSCRADIKQTMRTIQKWFDEHGYKTGGVLGWGLDTVPQGKRIAHVRLCQAWKPSPFDRWRMTWQGIANGAPPLAIECLSSESPPQTLVTIRSPAILKTVDGRKAPTWARVDEILGSLDSVLKSDCEKSKAP